MSGTYPSGLTLVLGPANSGKLGLVLEWWEARLASRPLIVVPTGPDARGLSVEMAQRAGALVGQSPAITFDGLVRLLLGRSPRYAGDFERSLLISHLLHDDPPRAPGFSARFPGTAMVVGALLEQLGDSGRAPEEIEQALVRWASVDEGSALLAVDIQRLSVAYRSLRGRLGLADRSDLVREALAAAGGWNRPLAFYGFTSFTLGQRRLIAALAYGTEAVLVFDYERSRERGLTTPGELASWEAIATRTVELEPGALAYRSPAIAYLERHFMDDGPRPEPPPAAGNGGGVRFLLASGQRNEAELAAEQVVGLIRAGLRPGVIAVVVRHMKTWGRLLQDVFTSCGIACQVDERFALGETGLGHAFLAALRGVAEDDPSAVMEYLRSPFSGLTLEQAGDLELDYLRRTARGVAALLGCAHAGPRPVIEKLSGLIGRGAEGMLVDPDAAQALARRMLENGLRGSSGGPPGSGDVAADARAFLALQNGLSGLGADRARDLLPAGALRPSVLLPALARMDLPRSAPGPEDAVQVLTAHRARARRFEAVLVLGLVEGEFPGRTDRPALLTDAQRERLDAVGGGLFSPEVDEEEALFVRAVSRARTYLFLSSRDADDGGGYAGQSYYWTHCKALLAVGDREQAHRTLADQVFDLAGAPTRRQYLRACAAKGVAPHPACEPASPSPPEWRRRRATLVSKRALDELASTQSFSPSALESYLMCPFIWFVERVVGIEKLEMVVDRQFFGQLMHKVLSDTYQELRSAGVLPLSERDLPLALSTASMIAEALVDGEECPGTPPERRLAKHRLTRMAANLFAMEVAGAGARSVVHTELAVGGEEGIDVGGVSLRGRIDRVDSTPGGDLFVVDYKSGGLPDKRKIGTAEGLQLPLYLLALAAERPAQRVVGGEYVSPPKRERAGVVAAGCEGALGMEARSCRSMGDDELLQMLQQALTLAREAAEGIRSGKIAPRTDRSCPDWCRLGSVCRTRRGGRRRRR